MNAVKRPAVPPVMTDPSLMKPGDNWVRLCPHRCSTLTGIQGGSAGLAAHMATVHPGEQPPGPRKRT